MPSNRLIAAMGAALFLMFTIGLSGYYTMGVWNWDPNIAAPVMIGGNLLLAWLVISRFNTDRAYSDPDAEARLLRRRKQLGSDPSLQKYVEDLDRGVILTDEQIAYMENPSARASCPDLRPIEGLLKQARVKMYPFTGANSLTADCRLDEGALRKLVDFGQVKYSEYFDEREGYQAYLNCEKCRYTIWVRHAELGGPVFPAG
jgi:hypothetical protein